ncbi:MAG TPA: sigma-70 family RNA polymerase sigma factor [Noviherbaspirillum sp.]|uniref:sigma-70 family RNA polymerase sigma factor n=1 Tax=Noviherbaspirillum sp. TaxID=1926288 RepID=UPI002B477DB3|nr:sigma-70 family RNA polymerase sigma factor [Noviherbaspirillum sp.]HJV87821.1 sigma-70 family RNA polymerase sigma factor [Noviherbaspirillum sp.]
MADFADELASQIPRLRRYARALTHDASWADDLVQDTLERALQRRWLFRINSNLTAWLLTMLHRLYLNEAPRRQLVAVPIEELPEAVAPGEPGQQLDVRRALASLSPEHRAVIVLVGLEQLRYQEVAEVLNVPLGTVMSRLARARAHLRELLSGQPASGSSTHLTRVK